jgi:Ca2+-binding EF-hand superfamily protein
MADHTYDGEITKEQFMVTVSKLKANLDETQINQMFYAIDSNLNGKFQLI